MPRVMKPPTTYNADDTDTGANFYDGPPPPPGLYKGVVKKMLLQKIKGEDRIMIVCEIADGKYKGAGVTKWLQLTEQGSPWVNQFLHSLTDGSEAQMRGIRKAFKEVGYTCDDMDQKKRLPIIKIGKKTNPIGKQIAFVTKLRTNPEDNITRAEISRFVIPRADTNGEAEYPGDTDAGDDPLDDVDSNGLDEFSTETTLNGEPEAEIEAEAAVSAGVDDDADDPWSM